MPNGPARACRPSSNGRPRVGAPGICADDRPRLAMDALVLRPLSRLPAAGRAVAANTTASSWSASWCCAAAAAPRRPGTRGPPTAISFRRRRAGSSRACGSPGTRMLTRGLIELATAATSPAPRRRATAVATLRHDLIAGAEPRPRSISPKYFYDARGSALFDRICELPEYYPTRTELASCAACAARSPRRSGPTRGNRRVRRRAR